MKLCFIACSSHPTSEFDAAARNCVYTQVVDEKARWSGSRPTICYPTARVGRARPFKPYTEARDPFVSILRASDVFASARARATKL